MFIITVLVPTINILPDVPFRKYYMQIWLSSGLLRRVDWYKSTKVSEVRTASIIRAFYSVFALYNLCKHDSKT
jgi:hypothetical protein